MQLRDLLQPRFTRERGVLLFRLGLTGALVAGAYGIVHDQITYSIGPEYFSGVKFHQFRWADFGFPDRIFVGEIGFLATHWVGFLTGWALGRVSHGGAPVSAVVRGAYRGFGITLGGALLGAIAGFALFFVMDFKAESSGLVDLAESIGVADVPGFVRVALIHNGGYLGAMLGLIISLVRQRRRTVVACRAGGVDLVANS